MSAVEAQLATALAVLAPARDLLDGRVESEEPPAWCEARGWTGFLAALGDEEVARCEAEGLGARIAQLPGAPSDLVDLAAAIDRATRLPPIAAAPRPVEGEAARAVSARKREQLGALLGALGPVAERAARIVDVGAGSGHLTRLAGELFAREALGLDRDPARVAAATARAGSSARFLAVDADREPPALRPDDLALGLHACGALGDVLIATAAQAGCSVALVSCCFQKIGGEARPPLSRAAAGLTLRREILGLANLASVPRGVEVSIDATMAAREARWALRGLLRERGVALAPGEEMRGINRRRARHGLTSLAAVALEARGLAPASPAEIERHQAEGRRRFDRVRRLSLPRSMLGRLVEVAVVLDRAAALAERGSQVEVGTLCDRAATPRNLLILAQAR